MKAEDEKTFSDPQYDVDGKAPKPWLKRAKDVSDYYNLAAFPLVIILLFIDSAAIIVFCFLYCLGGLLLIHFRWGQFSFFAGRNPIFIGFVSMSIFGAATAIGHNTILNLAIFSLVVIFFALAIFWRISTAGLSEAEQSKGQALTVRWISALAYAVLVTYFINCSCDFATGIPYQARVESKRYGRRGNYSITVGPWGHRTTDRLMMVDGSFYSSVRSGDRVIVTEKPGLLGAAWFSVEKESKK